MWAFDSVFYQIYPIGFCGAPRSNDGVTVPRIRKVADWAEHIARLGCSTRCLRATPTATTPATTAR